MPALAEELPDNDGTLDVVQDNESMDTNSGEINENHGSIDNNSGSINSNTGDVTNNDGTISSNEGYVENNYGTVENNSGTVYTNNGDVIHNEETVSINNSFVETNDGTVENNQGEIELNTGNVDNNMGEINHNDGTVYNSGVVKVNKGKVFNNGGIIEDDQGEHYFRVWLSLPIGMSDNAWSYTVDKGFVTYRDFDRWIEKNGVGQITFKLNSGYGWEYDYNAPRSEAGYKGQINGDGTMTIIVDRMNEWMTNVMLIIPVKKVQTYSAPESDYVVMNTVSFDLDGGAFNKDTEEEEDGIVERSYAQGEEITFTEVPEKEGYKFLHWEEQIPEDEEAEANADESTDATNADAEDNPEKPTYKIGDTYVVIEDVTFKAIWEKDDAK